MCHERDLPEQERDAARVAARAEEEVATLPESVQKIQDELVASKRHRAAAEDQYDVLKRSKGLCLEASAAI